MNMNKLITFAAVAASAAAAVPSLAATQTVTNTVNGITWRLLINTTTKTAAVGPLLTGTQPDDTSDYAVARAIAQSVTGTIVIPDAFMVDGEKYTVNSIGNRAFIRCRPSTFVFPAGLGDVWNCAFYRCYNIATLVFKGPAMASPGETQTYSTLVLKKSGSGNLFGESTDDSTIKRVLVGPNMKMDSSTKANFNVPSKTTDAVILLPSTSENTTWNGVNIASSDTLVLYYGVAADRTAITFSTANAAELIALLDFAPLVKEYLGLDTRLSITDSVTMTEEQATALSAFGFDVLAHVKFEVKDATQYANTVAAVPGAATVIVDPAKLRGASLAVPAGRKVIVPLPNGGKYSPAGNGKLTLPRVVK